MRFWLIGTPMIPMPRNPILGLSAAEPPLILNIEKAADELMSIVNLCRCHSNDILYNIFVSVIDIGRV